MSIQKLLELANDSGGTLYLMCILLLVALTVIIERCRHILTMQKGGEDLIKLLRSNAMLNSESMRTLSEKYPQLPHMRMTHAATLEPVGATRETVSGHLEEALMHEVPMLDRSLWMLDTVITLAPLLGLFGTIIGMFNAFSVLGDAQNGATQITGGIAEALVATASGLLIAMIGLVFFNWLNTRIRVIVHQLETIKIMLLNRKFANNGHAVEARLKSV